MCLSVHTLLCIVAYLLIHIFLSFYKRAVSVSFCYLTNYCITLWLKIATTEIIILWVGNLGWAQLGDSSGLHWVHSCVYHQVLVCYASLLLGVKWMLTRTRAVPRQQGL